MTGETGVAMVQSSSDFKCSISVGVVAQLGGLNELRIHKMEHISSHNRQPRQPKMKELAFTSTGYKYDVADSDSDSDSDNDLFNDIFG